MRATTAAFATTLVAVAASLAGCGGSPGPQATPRSSPTPPAASPPAPGSRSLSDLHMISASVGWAIVEVGSESPPPGRGAHVIRTTDGGAHWTTVAGDGRQPIDADVHDADTAWVLEVDLAHSTPSAQTVVVRSTADGGRSWSTTPPLRVEGMATHLQFADVAHGWVYAAQVAGGAGGADESRLYRTVDGGEDWQTVTPATQVGQSPGAVGGLPESCPGGGALAAPTFADAQRGWLGAFCSHPFLYATRDGGLSWTAQALPAFPGPASTAPAEILLYNTDSPQFTSPNDGVIFVHRGITTGANALQDAAICVSHDGGATWTASRLPAAELQAGFVDARHGWMVAAGPNGAAELRSLYTTTDGGATWSMVSGPRDYFAGAISFVTPALGFIGGSAGPAAPGLLLRTTDGGAAWTPVTTVVP